MYKLDPKFATKNKPNLSIDGSNKISGTKVVHKKKKKKRVYIIVKPMYSSLRL